MVIDQTSLWSVMIHVPKKDGTLLGLHTRTICLMLLRAKSNARWAMVHALVKTRLRICGVYTMTDLMKHVVHYDRKRQQYLLN